MTDSESSKKLKVVIKGAGDLATGVAYRLCQAGFAVVMLELPQPLVVRRTVAFASAVYTGEFAVEGLTAKRCSPGEIGQVLAEDQVPVCVDPEGKTVKLWRPQVVVDAIMAKRNLGTTITDAQVVIGLGPGFTAGEDAHAVIETQRGHDLGRVYYRGTAAPDTGVPGAIAGVSRERLLRAPAQGSFEPVKAIGDLVAAGETVAVVAGRPVIAEISGLVRGMLYPGLTVRKGMKVGDIDPRGSRVDYLTISDKARSIGGGVLEAILHLLR